MIWTTPLGLVVTIILLLVNLSYPALAGLALFFAAIPLMGLIVRSMLKRRKKINRNTDERVSTIQEVLQAIRFVKYYAWEADFLARLGAIRRREIRGIRYLLSHRNVAVSMGSAVPVFSSMLTFITSSLTNHALEPASTFSSLALFNQLRIPLIMFPMVVGLVTDALQSLKRIEQFFLAEDSPEMAAECKEGLAVDIRDASFTWEQSVPPNPNQPPDKGNSQHVGHRTGDTKEKKANLSGVVAAQGDANERNAKVGMTAAASQDGPEAQRPPFTLNNINLQVQSSELIAVIGSVGSGKSSLLSAIAGDMRQTSGTLQVRGKCALCAQVAWIQNATVRDNITFGHDFNYEEFERVIKACSLDHDLQNLPHGSFTEIGERGINLSGGQKQRVSLARAVYSGGDIVLLDDPLGAVDAHVGAHIMEHAICGLLKDKCRILVTHQLQVLPRCDKIVIMDNGRAIAFDTFQNLMADNTTFQRMMMSVNTEEREDVKLDETREPPMQPKSGQKAQESLMREEDRQMNGISKAVYLDYWRSTGSLLVPPLVLLVVLVAQGSNILTNLWLAWWSQNKFGYPNGVYVRTSSLCVGSGPLTCRRSESTARSGYPRDSFSYWLLWASPSSGPRPARTCFTVLSSVSCERPCPSSTPPLWVGS
jgi:ABC-type multidrug transport system fused ATPase/permease subunit